jgi:hypothetical protein
MAMVELQSRPAPLVLSASAAKRIAAVAQAEGNA